MNAEPAEDGVLLDTDRTTAAERIPIDGAYRITSAMRPYQWEGSIRWGNLRWWASGAAVVAFGVWLFLNWNVRLALIILAGAAVVSVLAVRAVVGYIELADKWATVQVKRHEARPNHRCVKCSRKEKAGR